MSDQAGAGSSPDSPEIAQRLRFRLTAMWALTTVLGALLVFVFVAFLLPVEVSSEHESRLRLVSLIVGAIYLPLTIYLGSRWATRLSASTWAWFEADRAPTAEERTTALKVPMRSTLISGGFWALGAGLMWLIQLSYSMKLANVVFDSILLGGVTTCALGYLLEERMWRPVVQRALQGEPPESPVIPGIRARMTMAWALATGVPLIGIFAVASVGLLDSGTERLPLGAITFLSVIALLSGLVATRLVAQSIADPLASVRSALARVERGELEAEVPVDDGSEIGLVQAGFNRMAGGLRERERLREVFGRHVGHDVARAALDGEVELGGEERDVAVLFVDLVGSTSLAAKQEPAAVVALLNSFFGVVVAVAEENGGWVNKFEGDGALCVFGAPAALDDPAGAALCTARELSARLSDRLPGASAGIGVSAGRAVAGNVGAENRYEYTVIGDPVNEAARLCDLAKGTSEGVLASQSALDRVSGPEAAHWTVGESVTLRGRDSTTALAAPAGAATVPTQPG